MAIPPSSPPPSLNAPRRRHSLGVSATELNFHATALVWLCATACLWVVGWMMARLSAPPRPPSAEIVAAFVPWARTDIAPEPDERRLYVVLTLLSPLLLLAAWAAVRRFLPQHSAMGTAATATTTTTTTTTSAESGESRTTPPPWRGSTAWTAASAAAVFILGGGAAHLWLSKSILADALQPAMNVGLLPAVWAGILAFWWALTRRARRRPRWLPLWRWACLVAALPLIVAGGLAYRIFDYRTVGLMTAANMNTTLYSIAQAAMGQRMLVDFVPQYGCYAEMLKPWFAVIGLSTAKASGTLAGLHLIALASMAFVLWRLMRSGWLWLVGVAMLVWLTDIWRQSTGNGFDPYIQYYPIRVIFPALSLLAAWAYLRRPTSLRAAAAGLLGGLAVWWNVDSGAVTLVSLLGLVFAKTLSEGIARSAAPSSVPGTGRWRGAWHLAAALGAAALALVGFYLVLCLDARQRIDLGAALRYQNIFYISGFFMLRMPASPHLWHAVAGVYLLGLAASLGGLASRRPLGLGNGMVLYLSVLGLGLFSYYQGRSHDIVLMLCAWPAGALVLLWCDRQLAAARGGLLPRACAAAALPALTVVALCALSLWQSRAGIVEMQRSRWQMGHAQPSPTHIPAGVACIKGALKSGEPCAVISPWQAVYFLAMPRRSAFTGQSFFECLLQSDVETVLAQIRERRAAHLFTERAVLPYTETPVYGPDYGRARYDAYRVVGRGADGWMLQWAARSDEDARAEPPGRLAREFAALTRLKDSLPTPRHALRCASSAAVLLDPDGECATAPYDWGKVPFGNAWAIEMAFTPAADQPANACLISNHPGSGFDGLTIQRPGDGGPGEFLCLFGNGHGYTLSERLRFEPGREHYLALCGEANRVTIYVDGARQQEVALPAPVTESAMPLTVGDWIAAGRAFRGDIAEVKIHDRTLTAEMVARNAENVRAGHAEPASP